MKKSSKITHDHVAALVTALVCARVELVKRICYDGERDGLSSSQIDDKIRDDATVKTINQAIASINEKV